MTGGPLPILLQFVLYSALVEHSGVVLQNFDKPFGLLVQQEGNLLSSIYVNPTG